ncbi:unnamed protein product [Sphagnum jensenii]|uniref:Uncharacterized protein n=1 Tax=Sphagnum jensenii TaxID=128206 RepID=A0ABP0VXY9_9BRYO
MTSGRRGGNMMTQALTVPPSSIAMVALSGLHERQETTRRTLRCSLERSGAASHNNAAARNVAVLHVLLWRCSAISHGVASCDAVALQLVWLRHYGAARGCSATCGCNVMAL